VVSLVYYRIWNSHYGITCISDLFSILIYSVLPQGAYYYSFVPFAMYFSTYGAYFSIFYIEHLYEKYH
jgi:hypothetical protein